MCIHVTQLSMAIILVVEDGFISTCHTPPVRSRLNYIYSKKLISLMPL